MKNSQKIVFALENTTQVLWGIFFILFPIFFTSLTVDNFILPKQALLGIVACLSLLLFATQSIVAKKVMLRQTSMDLPVFLLFLALILSVVFAVNRYDAVTALVPMLFLGFAYFSLINTTKTQHNILFLAGSLIIGGSIVSLLGIFSFFKTYLLPFALSRIPNFTPLGSLVDQAIYLAILLPVALYFAYPIVKNKTNGKVISFAIASLIILGGLGITIYQLCTSQKPTLLPFGTGFQIAFATISQDAPRTAQGFFFGSGLGTFITDFTRFKQASFNSYQNIWFLSFFQSSSFVLEILTTTGIIGLLAYIFIIARIVTKPWKKLSYNPFFLSLVLVILASLILPFSFINIALFFFILALFVAAEGVKDPEKSVDLEFFLIALRRNLFNIDGKVSHSTSLVMPIVCAAIIAALVGVIGFFSTKYVIADVLFNQSIVAANSNNGSLTYQKQVDAINMFPYRDGFYRIFAQTNLSLANAILQLSSNKNQTDTQKQQNQQTALNLVQQAISTSKTAGAIAPETVFNWQNIATIYRSLIGFGQGAENFAITSTQQAIALDPTNPQEYMTLGGLYYQLNQYDNAIAQFQNAINLKQDFPNAYYNLGHAYESKGDLKNALANYQIVKSLTTDKQNLAKINDEIDVIQKRIDQANANNQQGQTKQQSANQTNPAQQLNINQPAQQLPIQATPIPLPTAGK